MAISKIILNGVTQMDVTQDTVASANLLSGYTATKNDGTKVNGSYVPPSAPTLQTKSKTYTPTTSQQTESITPDSGYDGLDKVNITVNAIQTETKSATPSETAQTITPSSGKYLSSVSIGAIASDYVGSGVTRRSSTDLTASGATVTVPSGYYSASASKSVASGTAGTPTATKGTVSNHSVSVTPSVTNTTGYITGGTKSGTAVSVSASELVSGTLSVTSSGTKDVTNYASASIPNLTLPSNTASSSIGTIKGSIIPSTGFNAEFLNIPAGFNNTAQYYQVDPVPLDTLTVTSNGTYDPGTYDCAGFSSVTVNIAFSTIYTGSGNPSSATGTNGDIYLKVVT